MTLLDRTYILTNDEKLDYIYQELRKGESDRRWSRIWKWIWRIFLIASTFWLYLHPESIFNLTKELTGSMLPNIQSLQTTIDVTGR